MALLPSVLWRCWLGGRIGIQPVKTDWWGTGMVICLERGANDLHMVQLMPLPPIISCSSKIQNGLPFWCRLTQVVLEKRLLNGCSVVVVVVSSNSSISLDCVWNISCGCCRTVHSMLHGYDACREFLCLDIVVQCIFFLQSPLINCQQTFIV